MTDQSGTGGIGSITALPCGTARFQTIFEYEQNCGEGS
jgi:hypothetical protein